MKEIDEINSVKEDDTGIPEKPFVAEECFRVGLSDIGPIPKFNVMKFMRVIMVGILFYAVNTVVVNRMTRYQNQKILMQQQGYA
jgi:hypothetical protein